MSDQLENDIRHRQKGGIGKFSNYLMHCEIVLTVARLQMWTRRLLPEA